MDWVEWNIKHNHCTVNYFKKWSNGKKISFGVFRDCCLVAQSCLTVCDPIDCSLPDSSVLGISQARILECVAISSSRGSSQQGIIPGPPALALHHWATREDHFKKYQALSHPLSHCESWLHTQNWGCVATLHRPAIAETWYAISYLHYSTVGCLGCIAAGVIISFLTGQLHTFLFLGPRKTRASLVHCRMTYPSYRHDLGFTTERVT